MFVQHMFTAAQPTSTSLDAASTTGAGVSREHLQRHVPGLRASMHHMNDDMATGSLRCFTRGRVQEEVKTITLTHTAVLHVAAPAAAAMTIAQHSTAHVAPCETVFAPPLRRDLLQLPATVCSPVAPIAREDVGRTLTNAHLPNLHCQRHLQIHLMS